MNKVIRILKNSSYGLSQLESVYEAARDLYNVKSYNAFPSYHARFYARCRSIIGYHFCLLDLELISWEESQDFLDIIYRYTDFVSGITRYRLNHTEIVFD